MKKDKSFIWLLRAHLYMSYSIILMLPIFVEENKITVKRVVIIIGRV